MVLLWPVRHVKHTSQKELHKLVSREAMNLRIEASLECDREVHGSSINLIASQRLQGNNL